MDRSESVNGVWLMSQSVVDRREDLVTMNATVEQERPSNPCVAAACAYLRKWRVAVPEESLVGRSVAENPVCLLRMRVADRDASLSRKSVAAGVECLEGCSVAA